MAGEIQLNSTTLATESSGSITAQLDTIRPNTTNGSLTLQGDNSGTGVSGITIDSSGNAALGGVLKLKSSGNSITANNGTTSVLSESGGTVTLDNTTLSTNIVFPTRSDFGIVELIDVGQPIIGQNSTQDYSYTSGEKYFVFVDSSVGNEYYEISTSNVVTEPYSNTATITPSIPTAGTLRITTGSSRELNLVILIRMSF